MWVQVEVLEEVSMLLGQSVFEINDLVVVGSVHEALPEAAFLSARTARGW